MPLSPPVADVLPDPGSELVLLVDDSDDDVVLFQRAYKEAGITNPLRIVHGGEEAIAYLHNAETLPALVLLDLKMPGTSGFDVLHWLRQDPRTAELRVIVLTSSDEVHTVDRAYKLGANSFLMKAVSMNDFVGQLREIKKHWL